MVAAEHIKYALKSVFKLQCKRSGKVYVSVCPGKADLTDDLQSIKEKGVSVIVCLTEWKEMKNFKIKNYPYMARENGFVFYHVPIPDESVPKLAELQILFPLLVNHLYSGKNVLIHCMAGKGRSCTITACLLCYLGISPDIAVKLLRRGVCDCIDNKKQINFITKYWDYIRDQY